MQAIFVGGTGRSGTTIIGQLLGHHRDLVATMPKEVRFITDPHGLRDLLDEPTQERLETFIDLLTGKWWSRTGPDGGARGLHRGVARGDLEAAIREFRGEFDPDPRHAAERLVRRLLDPMANRAGANGWVETTPGNAAAATTLHLIIADMKLVRARRDPRDTIASVLAQPWGPSTVDEAITWVHTHTHAADQAISHVPPRQVHTVWLEKLVIERRAETYGDLLDFLDLDDDRAMREFFDERMTEEAAAVGRFRSLPHADQAALNEAFAPKV